MATYSNAYQIASDVRRDLDEYSDDLLQGTDATGAFDNTQILIHINNAQRIIYSTLLRKLPGIFLKSTTITGSNSVYTLPWDFGALRYFKDENGYKVYQTGINQLHLNAGDGSDRLYYRKGNTLVLDKDGVSETYTLFYYSKPREIHYGQAYAGSTASMTLDSTYAKKIADYYNGMTVENETSDWVDTIDDYSADRVATISEEASANDWYGLVSELPEMFHFLISMRAVMSLSSSSPVSKQKTPAYSVSDFTDALISTIRAFAGTSMDFDFREMFEDFEPATPIYYGIIATD